MLLVFMITRMVDYGIRNGPKLIKKIQNNNVHLQEWLEIVYWRQQGFIFYTEPSPQERLTRQKNKRILLWVGGVRRSGGLTVFWFFHIRTVARFCFLFFFFVHKYVRLPRKKEKKKACNHTQGGCLCTLAVGHILFRRSCLSQKVPWYHHTHMHTHTHTRVHTHTRTSFKGAAALHEHILEGKGRIYQLLNRDSRGS